MQWCKLKATDNYCVGACANWIVPPCPCYWINAHDWSGNNHWNPNLYLLLLWMYYISKKPQLAGWKRRQDHRSVCWWSRVPSLQRHQGASSSPSSWNPPLLWGLYPQYNITLCFGLCFVPSFHLTEKKKLDKKNENKKVDVEGFLPAQAAIDAIKDSM